MEDAKDVIMNGHREHHVWCNGQKGPVDSCRWCGGPQGLWALYPYWSEDEMDGLMAKHFPQNIRRT